MTQFEKRTPDWLSVREAVARILSRSDRLPSEEVTAQEALGRALSENVYAKASLPPWDNSAMDGYAVIGRDISGASRDTPATLEVVGETLAGRDSSHALVEGQAVRIMTGGQLPAGADTVIRVEDTDAEKTTGRVRVFSDSDLGRHIRPEGQDMEAGAEVLPAGTTIGSGQLGLLLAAGASTVAVHRRPRVAALSNGDELATPEEFDRVLNGEAIPETNSPTLSAAVAQAGGIPIQLGIARDTPESIMDKVQQARDGGADVLVTSGGASLGERDLFKRVLTEAGLTLDFWRVKMRPGTPFSFGFLPSDDGPPLPVFGLPGNPGSSFVTFQVLCRPFILRLAGHQRVHRPVQMAVAGDTLKSPSHLTHFFRVGLDGDPGMPTARLTGPQVSGLVNPQGLARGLAVVPEGLTRVEKGENVRVVLLDDMGLGGGEVGYLR